MGNTMKRLVAGALIFFSTIVLAAQNQDQEAPPPGKGNLDVSVVDETGKPLPGVTVSVPGYRSTTGVGGTCRFGLLPGRYSVLIKKDGYRGRRINAGVRPGETFSLRVELQKLVPARPPRK
ncbi:MAG: carboxypeptidase-like regulatory domain-containing protein [Terriglobia bacterium]